MDELARQLGWEVIVFDLLWKRRLDEQTIRKDLIAVTHVNLHIACKRCVVIKQ